jgi:hypothetical protein
MNEDFVNFEIAKKLKEKGFREKCMWHYYDDTKDIYKSSSPQCYNYGGNTSDAPTIPQVLKWLREEKKIHIGVLYHGYYAVWIQPMKRNEAEHVIHDCKTYEEAELEGIEYVLDNLI